MWPFDRKKKTKSTGRRAFAGAALDRLVADWVAGSTSQDAEIRFSLPRLRNRSRELGRNNDYVRQFFRVVQNNVVGQGIPFQGQVRMLRKDALDRPTNESIEELWQEWCRKENCHVAGLLGFADIERLVIRSVFESGEIIVRFIYQNMGGMKTRLALEVIESDLLDDNYNEIGQNGNEIRMGVERNQWGRPVAYHFFVRHPGDTFMYPNDQIQGRRVRVPASEIIHLYPMERTNQTRGVPALASAMLRLRHLQGYEEAEVIAARASAALMGFLESPEEEPGIKDGVDGGQSVTEFEPGVFKKLNPGEKVVVPTMNRPGGQFDPFTRAMIRGAAAGMGASFESVSRDYSQSNYTSSRLALLEDRDNWRAIQKWLISNFHQAVFEKWLDMAVLSGEISLKNYELNPRPYRGVKWMPRGWSWVDPLKEVQAYKEAVRSGFMTLGDVVGQAGGDIEELMTQRQREVELADEKGLVFDTDAALVNKLGVQQPDGAAAETAGASGNPPPADEGASTTTD
ncbi:MAG: phage portal protein [Bdellovibrionota bacterium]